MVDSLKNLTSLQNPLSGDALRKNLKAISSPVSKATEIASNAQNASQPDAAASRSEERRVAKECRSRWWPYH